MPIPIGIRALNHIMKQRLVYLLYDKFNTDQAAPLGSTRLCEPGPGTRTVTDGGNRISTSNGAAVWTGGDANSYFSTQISYDDQPRAGGRAMILQIAVTNAGLMRAGWRRPDNTASLSGPWISNYTVYSITSGNPVGMTLVAGTAYEFATVLRSGSLGSLLLIRGGDWPSWTLAYVDAGVVFTAVTPWIGSYSAALSAKNVRVLDLPAPWNTDYGIATSRLVSPNMGATATHTPDALIEWTFTYNGTTCSTYIREVDANNRWELNADASGNLNFISDVAGTRTWRAGANGVFTSGQTYRLVIALNGNVYAGYVNNVQKFIYTDPSSFHVNATGVRCASISGGVSELVCWPRYPSFPNV